MAILIVLQNTDLADNVGTCLRHTGFTPKVCSSITGQEFTKEYERAELVVTDLTPPVLNLLSVNSQSVLRGPKPLLLIASPGHVESFTGMLRPSRDACLALRQDAEFFQRLSERVTSLVTPSAHVPSVPIGEDAGVSQKQVAADGAHRCSRNEPRSRKRINQQVQFIGNIAHDLRTPLAAIGEFAQLLRSAQPGSLSGQQQRYVDIIERRSDDASRMIGNLLDAARLQSGCIHPHRQILEMPVVLADIQEVMELAIRHSGVKLATESFQEMPQVFADRDMLSRILANLTSNAIKFSPADSTVTIRAERYSVSMARISVIDCGTGISSQDLRRIFHRFKQGSNHAPNGFGLGLAIVRELVKLHGGNVVVESTLGKGTRFHFTLPLFIPGALIRRYLGRLGGDPSLVATAWWVSCEEKNYAAVHRLISATVHARDLVLPESEQRRILLVTQSKRPDRILSRLCHQISAYGGVVPEVSQVKIQEAKDWLSHSATRSRPASNPADGVKRAG